MSNMRISWPNRLGDASFISRADGWAAQLPPSNLATRQIAQVARSVGLTNVHVNIDTGSAVNVGNFAAVGHNLTSGGQIRLRGYSTDPLGAYWWDFGPTTVQDGITITAPSTGNYWGADGKLKAGGGSPRYTHAELTAGGECLGLLLEPTRTNRVLHSRDGTNAAWTKSNLTAERVTGVDGVSQSATRITATASTGRISQAITLTAATRRFSLYARRVEGEGGVSITVNNFSATTTIVLTTDWQRFDIAQTLSNPTVGIQIGVAGNAVDFDCVQLEEGAYATTPIHTTTAAVARPADSFTAALPANTASTMLARLRCVGLPTADEVVVSNSSAITNGRGLICTAAGNFAANGAISSTTHWTLGSASATTERTYCVSMATNDIKCSLDGAAVTTDASATVQSLTQMAAWSTRTGSYVLKLLAWWTAASSTADVEALSGTLARSTADYDSTATDAWPAAWVSGTTAEQRAGTVGCAVLSPAATYRYWRLDLIDAANPAGYLELGRVFGGSAWQPTYNAVYGASLGYEDRDVITEMDSGSEYMRKRPAPRVAQFALPALSDAEAIGTVLEMQRRQGSSGEVLYEWDPADTAYAPARRFLARLRRVSPLRAMFLDRHEAEFEVKELL